MPWWNHLTPDQRLWLCVELHPRYVLLCDFIVCLFAGQLWRAYVLGLIQRYAVKDDRASLKAGVRLLIPSFIC